MLKDEARLLRKLMSAVTNKIVLNVCSSDETFWKKTQPFVWQDVMLPLKERSCQLINLDMKATPGVDIVNDCTNMLDVADKSIDVVLFFSGIEHIVDPSTVLAEIKRVLKDKGVVYMSAPGVYPKHNDPIDTMLRLPTRKSWEELLGPLWHIKEFRATTPMPASAAYNFNEQVYATIVEVTIKE
jgi:SAM-dependent methyltransferase